MKLVLSVATLALLVHNAATFLTSSNSCRKSLPLNSLLDEAYDVPSIAEKYSKSGGKAAGEIAKAAKAAKNIPKTEAIPSYDTSVGDAATVSSPPPAVPPEVPAATDSVASKVDDFLNAANEIKESLPDVKETVATGVKSFKPLSSPLKVTVPEIPPATTLEPGKVRSMAGYFREEIESGKFTLKPSADSLAESKEKVNALVDNAKNLKEQLAAGNYDSLKPKPEAFADVQAKIDILVDNAKNLKEKIAAINVDMPDSQFLVDAKTKITLLISNVYELFGKEPPQNLVLPDIPENSIGWIAAGFAAIFALTQRNAGVKKAKAEMGEIVEKEAAAASEIAVQLVSEVFGFRVLV